ncbi:MAG: two-component regulator propeller domain-containing protein [Bacteroidales bacterium]|nr:two-component regulator propeller domain-containing protein [Bacteroidales bacterium]
MKRTLLSLVFLLAACCSAISASIDKDFEISEITSREGLSNSSVNCITQDSYGRIWLGTWDGLNLYDGVSFRCFKPDPSLPGTISNTIIRQVVEQRKGVVWVSTDMGVNRYDEKSGSFRSWFNDNESLEIASENAFYLTRDRQGSIYVFIDGNGAYRFNDELGGFEKILQSGDCSHACFDDESAWVLLKDGNLVRLFMNEDGEVVSRSWIGENYRLIFSEKDAGAVFCQKEDGTLERHECSGGRVERLGLLQPAVCACADDESLLLGGEAGLVSLDRRSGKVRTIASDVCVLSVERGSQDIIWVGTDMLGAWQLMEHRSDYFKAFPKKDEQLFSGRAVRCFNRDERGRLLVGTKGRGLYVFNASSQRLEEHYTTSNGMIDNAVYCISRDRRGRIWMGTDGLGLNYFDKGELRKLAISSDCRLSSVYAILPWGDDELWVGTSGNGLFRLSLENRNGVLAVKSFRQYRSGAHTAFSDVIYALEKKDDDNLWIGSRGRGVVRYCVSEDRFIPLSEDISRTDVLSLLAEPGGRLWVGTSSGLFIFPDPETPDVQKKINERNHLPNNTVHAMLMDRKGRLWASTNNGLARIQENDGEYNIVPYYVGDGLYGNEFADGAAFAYGDETFLFGNINGFTVFNPLKVLTNNYEPAFVLEQFRLDNEERNFESLLDEEGTLVVPRGTKSLSLSYVPVDYLNINKRNISYIVEGMYKDWIDLGHSNTIVLTKMKPGRYVLKVRCSSTEGSWNEAGVEQPILVRAAWYASPWAFLGYALVIVLTVGLASATVWQLRKNRKERDLRRVEKEKMVSVHEAKLDFFTGIAHEFSNSLTLIYGPCVQILRNPSTDYKTRHYAHLIEKNSERMRTMIQELLDFRKAETGHLSVHCNEVDVEAVLERNLEFFSNELQEQEISIRSDVRPAGLKWLTDSNYLEKILFNLVSNAVKYTPAKSSIEVAFVQEDDFLVLTVTNYGVGIDEKSRKTLFNSYEVLRHYERNAARGRRSSNGLGLAMCKDLAQLLGGSIDIESDNVSSRKYVSFTVRIPKMNDHPQEQIETGDDEQWRTMQYFSPSRKVKSIGDGKPKGRSILIVDDDEEILEFISDLFCEKFDIRTAGDGLAALDSIRQQTPDIIISDIVMPKMDGLELVKAVKADEMTRHIPLILLSTKNTVEEQVKGLAEGADGYVNKPFNPKHLSAVVDSLLNRDKAVLEYSNSGVAAMDLYSGKVVTKETKRLLTKVTDVIMKNISNENMSLDEIAEKTATSRMKIYRAMKTSLDMTPTEYIRSIRLQHAEKLLRTTKKTVQEVMYECGFSSKAYFHKVFFAKYGHTPKEYRDSR